jgi:hypothetical protein
VIVHRAFGHVITANRPIPGLGTATHAAATERGRRIDIVAGRLPEPFAEHVPTDATCIFPASADDDHDYPLTVHRCHDGRWYHFHYADDTRFVIQGDGGRIWMQWREPLVLDDAVTYLLGPVIAFVLRLRGVLCLHASAVTIDGRAVALCGPPGAGKSTMAAAFTLAGVPLLTDDVAPIMRRGTRLFVQPAYPQVRLWPPATRALFGTDDALPRLTPSWDKRGFDSARYGRFDTAPRPLGMLCLLGKRDSSSDAPRLEPISDREAFVTLLGNLHTTRIAPRHAQQAMFAMAADLVRAVPVWRLVAAASLARLGALCDLVRDAVPSRCTH